MIWISIIQTFLLPVFFLVVSSSSWTLTLTTLKSVGLELNKTLFEKTLCEDDGTTQSATDDRSVERPQCNLEPLNIKSRLAVDIERANEA